MRENYYDMNKADRAAVRRAIALRAYQEIPAVTDGKLVVNVGWGIPLGIIDILAESSRDDVLLQGESCAIGMGRYLGADDDYDMHHVDPAGTPYKPAIGGCHTKTLADAFAFINSKKLYATFLGAFQVAANGDFANWDSGDTGMKAGHGGACALANGAKKVIVCMVEHDRDGVSKLVRRCTLPLTGHRCVDLVITDCGVYRPVGDKFERIQVYNPETHKYE